MNQRPHVRVGIGAILRVFIHRFRSLDYPFQGNRRGAEAAEVAEN